VPFRARHWLSCRGNARAVRLRPYLVLRAWGVASLRRVAYLPVVWGVGLSVASDRQRPQGAGRGWRVPAYSSLRGYMPAPHAPPRRVSGVVRPCVFVQPPCSSKRQRPRGAGGLGRPYVFVPAWLYASTARAPMARVGGGVSLRVHPTTLCVKPPAPPRRWRPGASLRVRPCVVKRQHRTRPHGACRAWRVPACSSNRPVRQTASAPVALAAWGVPTCSSLRG